MKIFICSLIALAVSFGTTSTALAKKDTKTQLKKRTIAQDAAPTGWGLFKYSLEKNETSAKFFAIANKTLPKPKCMAKECDSTYEDGGCLQAQISSKEIYICKVNYIQPGGTSYSLYMMTKNQTSIELNEFVSAPLDMQDEP